MHFLIGAILVFVLVSLVFGLGAARAVFQKTFALFLLGLGVLFWFIGDRHGESYSLTLVLIGWAFVICGIGMFIKDSGSR